MLGRLTGLPCPGLLHFTLPFCAPWGLCTPGERNGKQQYLESYPEIPYPIWKRKRLIQSFSVFIVRKSKGQRAHPGLTASNSRPGLL